MTFIMCPHCEGTGLVEEEGFTWPQMCWPCQGKGWRAEK